MPIEIKNQVEIVCKNCRTINFVTPTDLGNPEIDSEERSMGSEKEYLWENDFHCKKCNNEIHLVIRAFEYPVGFLNYMAIRLPHIDLVNKLSGLCF
jgi:hypothetical protein